MADVTTTLKDAAYVTVGLGVLGFQKAQVRRIELMKQLEDQFNAAGGQVTGATKLVGTQVEEATKAVKDLARDLEARLSPLRQQVEGRIDNFEELLPEQARQVVRQARTAARETQDQLRASLGLSSTAV